MTMKEKKSKRPTPESVLVGPIRFDSQLYSDLKAAAEADGRSLASYVRKAVSERVARDRSAQP